MDKKLLKKDTIFLLFLIFLFLISCTENKEDTVISLPAESAFPEFWGVLTEVYSVYYDAPESSTIQSYGRMGDIEKVIGKKITTKSQKTHIWYQFEKGWVSQSGVVVYENQRKAETSAKQLLE